MKTLSLFFRKSRFLNLCLCGSLLAMTGCKKAGESGASKQNLSVNQTTLLAPKANRSTSFDNNWTLSISAVSDPNGGSITITCHLFPQPVSGSVYYDVTVNGTVYGLNNNSIFIGTQPSTTYSISATAYYYTSIGTSNAASATTSIKTNAGSGIATNPGCPKYAALILFPLDTSTIANKLGWSYIQYDWTPPSGTTSKTPGTAQLRYREMGDNTWSYGQVLPFNTGATGLNHNFIINLIPGQSYQVQFGTDCNTGVVPVEADFDKNQIYSITAGPVL